MRNYIAVAFVAAFVSAKRDQVCTWDPNVDETYALN